MPHEGNLLQAAVVFLLAAVLTVPLAKHLKLGAVLGYLFAGVIIGPSVLGLVGNPQSVAQFSELGVVLLLFIIGLELSPKRLWVMRKAVFGVGLAQVLLTAMVMGAVALWAFGQSWNSAIVLGLGLALSSTAFGLQSLAERKELNSPHGRLAFAILLFQDIAAIPLIAMVPLLAGSDHTTTAAQDLNHGLQVLGSIAVVIIGGRYLLRPVFRIVAKTGLREVSTATALLVVIGTAWLMELVGVSMALGAFLAGLLLADSEYRHELESQIEPFKGLLLGLFFISVGMGANIGLLFSTPFVVLGLTLLLIAIKLPLLYAVGQMVGELNRESAVRLGVVLAAGGEFAFVVFKIGRDQGLFAPHLYDVLVLTITLSMALTPLLLLLCPKLFRPKTKPVEVPEEYRAIESDAPRVVIAGMGRMGQIVARILRAQNISFIALDTSVETIELTRSFGGMPVFYGDPQRPEILHAAKVDQAEYFVIAMDDPEINIKTAELVRNLYPHMKIIARARNRQHVHRLVDLDASPVRETFYSSLEMSRRTLVGLGLSETQADARINRFKHHDLQLLTAQHAVYDDAAKVMQSAQESRAELARLFEMDRLEEESGKV
ncbi:MULTISPECIES: monovalent cation:proton antiporter-2 (CPA2) family protein [Pseudomonas]|jgi:glutathione-regulated potassium-efflux system protein KefB|uniref:Glutathione-regulated potassium-efflux system protein KefB n=1 Tax=Pseudomonas proteolytica TaxID=219574 RepID=A0AAP7CW40_9PSED|nr:MULTISPECIES: monovalent cation:proton antiporter-2 (CPA2) family protein [Pseudomonas]VVO20985.1 Glutathione-regulated potassium-efflux system protein KefC [Pseudomonas fluorescens]KAA8700903.1 glutathione-regulated potassium-efflux system protein KefB [Pseudomonas proteolytica]MBC3336408.1 cation:proton antiporter [Pseudomonas proteolytica]MCF5058834.1 glutathione-regulated potassium-efflux system protein KefB [Pseudomonas proteolytica]MCF5105051.1 glutathione-regulated potassium-efflux s